METVSKLVDAGYKAIWGPGDTDSRTEVHDERRDRSKKTSGIASTANNIKAVDAGEWSLVPEQLQSHNIPHGEEPLSGVTGKGTGTDPYDAGNRDEQPGAPPIGIGDVWTQAVEHQTEGNSASNDNIEAAASNSYFLGDTGDALSRPLGVLGHDQASGGTGCEPQSVSGGWKDQLEDEKLAKGLQEIQLSKDHDTIGFETSSTEAIDDLPDVESDVETTSTSEEYNHPSDETTAIARSSFTEPVNSDPGRSSSSSTAPSSGEDDPGVSNGHKRVKSKILAKVKEKLDIGKHKHSRSAKA